MGSIERIAVLGLGTMGHGIAQSFAVAGYDVSTYDDVAAARDSLHDRIRRNLSDFVAAGVLHAEAVEPVLARISVQESEAAAVRDAQFVTEAVREDLATKQGLLARLEGLVAADTILASNSSTFPISQSGVAMTGPERAIVTHWFNPPHIVPAVEVVGGPSTSEATIQASIDLLRSAGKRPIRINQELPGFLVNRVQIALKREVWDLYDRGVASAEDIDAAISGSMGFRLAAGGPLQVDDFGGLDLQVAVYRNLVPEIASGTDVPAALQERVDRGDLGFKSGRGIYDYPAERAAAIQSERDQRYFALLRAFYSRTAHD